MSKSLIWQYNEFIESRKDKLVSMLISEIIFLKARFKNLKNVDETNHLKNALDKLEYLLNKLEKNNSDVPEVDFDKIIMMIYKIFKEIVDNLEGEVIV